MRAHTIHQHCFAVILFDDRDGRGFQRDRNRPQHWLYGRQGGCAGQSQTARHSQRFGADVSIVLPKQVYMTDLFSSVVTPNMELIGFTKVDIP